MSKKPSLVMVNKTWIKIFAMTCKQLLRETNFHKFREFHEFQVYPEKLFKMAIRENLSRKFFSTFQFAKIYPVKIFWFFWPLSLTTEILKQAYFSADSLFFLYFSLYLECNSKEQMQNFRLRYLNKVLQILTSLFLLI